MNSKLLIGWAERDVGLSLMGLGMVITGSVDMAVDKMKRPPLEDRYTAVNRRTT